MTTGNSTARISFLGVTDCPRSSNITICPSSSVSRQSFAVKVRTPQTVLWTLTDNECAATNTSSGSTVQKLLQTAKLAKRCFGPRTPRNLIGPDGQSSASDSQDEEDGMEQRFSKIQTIERVAAARIFLETYFEEALSGEQAAREMSVEELRRQLHDEMVPFDERYECERRFMQMKNAYRREQRVAKARRCKPAWLDSPEKQVFWNRSLASMSERSCVDNYETLQILGKGSFGVVKLVRKHQEPYLSQPFSPEPSRVFAMKVIRKSDMLRSCQEGHLRAERDFMAAAWNSNW